jgi:ABC-type transport system substrate-binding protein
MIGTKLAERYEILAELGRGGMGVVYRAKDAVLNREIAVKLIPPANLTKDAEERFQREAQIVAQMDHPGIVPIYDFGRHEGALFFVMPVLPGTNLRSLLREGSLRLGDVLDIGTQVADALDYSHGRGVVHRDIKPENIMTARDDGGHVRARVMDFGLALASAEDRLTKTGTLVGTVAYFSPEQVTSRAFDGRTDIYALGTVLYECLAGEPPFAGEVQAVLYRIVHELPQSLRAVGADVGEELQEIVFGCLAKDPDKRPRKAGHLAEALKRYRGKLHEDEYTRSVMLTASRMVARPQAAASLFVGREKEIAEMQRLLHAAVAGECQFAVVAGEPGTGKSRLVEQIANLARARKIRVLEGRFVEQDRAFAHQGFCELIQDYFRGKEPGSSAAARPEFTDLAQDLVSLFPVLSELGELRSAVTGEAGKAAVDARKAEDKTAVFELLARTLTRLAQGKPLLIVLENLHSADTSIEALQYIVRRLAPTPTLIVGTYRQTEVAKGHPLLRMLDSFAGAPRFLSLTLGPLSPSEHRALVQSVADAPSLAPDLAERLYQATEGNPFFTKELVRSLVDSGGIAPDDTGALSLSGAAELSADALPATIQQAVEKRIERLSDEVRDVLSTASVLGRSFDSRDLEELAEDAKGLDDAVDQLLRDGILEEERGSRGDRMAFSSGIVRDVLYNGLSRRNRRSLHRRYAEILEKQNADRLELVYPELVHHFSQGDVPEKTVEYGLRLAEKSLEAFSPEEATRAAKATLEFLEDKGWRGDRALSGEARLLLAQASQMSGGLDGAIHEAELAVRIFEREKRLERAVAAMLAAAEAAWQGRRADETRRWVERGIETAAAAGGSVHLGKLMALAITVANLRGEHQRAAAYQAQLNRLSAVEKEEAVPLSAGGRLVVAMANPVPANEPAVSQTIEEQEVLGGVFETLLTTDGEGGLAPGLAEEWELLDRGFRARLRLRSGVLFSDGTPLTAAAVKSSLERAIRVRPIGTPAALGAVRGAVDHREGRAGEIAGIRVLADDRLEIELVEALPIYPAFLTDALTGIVHAVPGAPGEAERLLGTGPFRVDRHTTDRVILERNPNDWKENRPHLDSVEFRTSLSASAIASGLRSGEIELARDLLPQDLEAILREPRLSAGLVEVPKKNTYFVVFNCKASACANAAVRRALAGVVRSQDFVWSTLGRFALPATGLIPPGTLGHDPGRRRPLMAKESARREIESSGVSLPLSLRATVHPILQDRYRTLADAVFGRWRELGAPVTAGTPSMAEYLETWEKPAGFDLMMARWNANYDDPDDFTFGLFHSRASLLRGWYSSPEADKILEEARGETRRSAREALYRRFEQLLLEEAVVIPLFHDVDYRIASPKVRGVALRSTPPFINYAEVGKVAAGVALPAGRRVGGTITVPIPGAVHSLDPVLIGTNEQTETLTSVFETLTRIVEGARIAPWLVSDFEAEDGGLRYRFHLRRGTLFHDGRSLTARDVRFSFEHLLQRVDAETRWLLSPIRGAQAVLQGERTDLEGFHLLSPTEFVIELEKPISFFPAIVSFPSTSILPEGTSAPAGSWRTGAAGTGPFRIVRFEPGRRLDLERNPGYWRDGYPRAETLSFRMATRSGEVMSEFVAGRLSIASDLLPADVETLRHDPRFASSYRESPRLSTYYLAFNCRRGPLADAGLRHWIADRVDASGVARKTLGRIGIPASGLIPPGLLGHVPAAERPPLRPDAAGPPPAGVELTAALHPVLAAEYAAFGKALLSVLEEAGLAIRVIGKTMEEYLELSNAGQTDLDIGRWIADYPDADTFIYGILHSRDGSLGRFLGRPDLDALATRGRTEADPSVRDGVYREVEDIVFRERLLHPLFHEQVYRFARPEVEGLTVSLSAPHVDYANLRVRD